MILLIFEQLRFSEIGDATPCTQCKFPEDCSHFYLIAL